ncbi:hypothetical protein [Pasteurella multocida]|uniref:hypothetical protein n=1 Tax=Pasteurella multocida TaxID=747 RepID=UPI0030D4ED89
MLTKLLDTLNLKKHYPFELQWAYKENEEFLATLYADIPYDGYYYAHVAKHPEKDFYVSCIVFSRSFITASDKMLFLAHFRYWMMVHLGYSAVSRYVAPYAYDESETFNEALEKLEKMVSLFDAYYAGLDDELEDDYPSNVQIIFFYGMTNFRDENGVLPAFDPQEKTTFH